MNNEYELEKDNFEDLVEYNQEKEFNKLDDFVEFLDTFQIPKNYESILVHLNSPIILNYINNKDYTPVFDEHQIETKRDLINAMANYHLNEKMDFYCGIRELNQTPDEEFQLFGNYLIQHHHNLFQGSSIEIPEPKIIITCQDEIAFPCIYDERAFTKENLELEARIFGFNTNKQNPNKNKLN